MHGWQGGLYARNLLFHLQHMGIELGFGTFTCIRIGMEMDLSHLPAICLIKLIQQGRFLKHICI